jgi:hypothetical protein
MRKKAIKFPNYNTEFIKSRENRGKHIVVVVGGGVVSTLLLLLLFLGVVVVVAHIFVFESRSKTISN